MARSRKVKKVGDPVIRFRDKMHSNWRHRYSIVRGKLGEIKVSSQNVYMASLYFEDGSCTLSTLNEMVWLQAPFNAWIRKDEYVYEKKATTFVEKTIEEAKAQTKYSRTRKTDDARTINSAESGALEAASIAFSEFKAKPTDKHSAYLLRMKAAVEAYKKFKGE